ncbi:hypothetical protein Tco_0505757 [Tanacetum coccineum]
MESQLETTQTVSILKLLGLKTREYDLWSMRMEQYFTFTDHALWEVIVNGDSVSPIASASASAEGPIPPKIVEQKLARKNELKGKSTLMLAIPNENLLKFHTCKDTKSLWEAIKNRFQKLISQLEIHGEVISQEDTNLKNVAVVSSNNSSSTNETVNTAHSVSAASSKDPASTASYVDDVMFSFFANQSNAPQFDNEDLEQIDVDDLEEMDLKWQVVMLTIRVKRNRDDLRRNAPVDTSTTNALVVQDGIHGYDWSFQAEEGITNFALMAYTSQGLSSSDFEREALNKYNLEIKGYQIGLESLEARIVVHEKNEAVYEEYIAFLKYDVQVKDISIKELKNQLKEALKEKDDLKLKLENFEESSKNLTKLINSQISVKDKAVCVNDKFKTSEGFHVVPPPYTRNYMPSRPDLSFTGLDDSVNKTKGNNVTTDGPKVVVSAVVGNGENAIKSSACWIWRPIGNVIDHTSKDSGTYVTTEI